MGDDDFTSGVLHSRVHEPWARGSGTQVREVESGFRYTPTTTFETFPFPRPTEEQRAAIAAAARRLNDLREGWLDPRGAPPEELEMRTVTNLYNQMPAWLRDAHAVLDAAVLAAYGCPPDISDDDLLVRVLALDLDRGGPGLPPTIAEVGQDVVPGTGPRRRSTTARIGRAPRIRALAFAPDDIRHWYA